MGCHVPLMLSVLQLRLLALAHIVMSVVCRWWCATVRCDAVVVGCHVPLMFSVFAITTCSIGSHRHVCCVSVVVVVVCHQAVRTRHGRGRWCDWRLAIAVAAVW